MTTDCDRLAAELEALAARRTISARELAPLMRTVARLNTLALRRTKEYKMRHRIGVDAHVRHQVWAREQFEPRAREIREILDAHPPKSLPG